MQAKEFDELMQGNSAKFAFLTENMNPDISGLLANAKKPGAGQLEVEQAREAIAKIEKEIDPKVRQEMDAFISKQREIGTKERTIRRMVQRLWNIQVF